MANWTGTRLTEAGQELQAKVEAGITKLDITRLKFGDGTETLAELLQRSDLKSVKYIAGISSRIANGTVCTITGIVNSANINAGFYAREMGLFANDPDKGEILYAASVDNLPDFVPPNTYNIITTAEYALNVSIANVDNLQIRIDLNGMASVEMMAQAAWLLQRNQTYAVGDIQYDTGLRPGCYLECIKAGTTGTNEIVLTDKKVGDIFTDGGVTWRVARVEISGATRFKKNPDGQLVPSKENVPAPEGVRFYEHPDGSISPAPRVFYSTAHKYNEDGSISPV